MNIILARLFARKIVITAHDVKAFASGHPRLSRMAYALAHSVIAHNVVSKNELIHDLGVSPAKICIIPHGNYPDCLSDKTSRRQARESLGLPINANILLFFGQIKEVKGLDILLDAMPRIIAEYPDTLLVIAGRPFKSTFDPYYLKINNLGIQNNCICKIQYIPDTDRQNYYKACDLVILPYRRIYQSGVLLMAMSYGRAILTSDIPGMLEIVKPNKSGFLFRDGDAGDLAQAVIQALSNPVLRNEVASDAMRLMRDNYDWNDIGRSTAELYRSL
jgi:glycosyltransferase involved in cell wall biosynthesis